MPAFDPYTAKKEVEDHSTPHCGHVETEEEAFEREKASIKCYEENWDDWDGPIWPKGTLQVDLGAPLKSPTKPASEHPDEDKTPHVHLGDH